MNTSTVIALIVALGGGATIKSLFDLITGRGRRRIEETATLTQTSERVIRLVNEQIDRAAEEAKKQADRAADIQDQLRATRDELHATRDELRTLRLRFDQVIATEKAWAEHQGHDDAPILRIAH